MPLQCTLFDYTQVDLYGNISCFRHALKQQLIFAGKVWTETLDHVFVILIFSEHWSVVWLRRVRVGLISEARWCPNWDCAVSACICPRGRTSHMCMASPSFEAAQQDSTEEVIEQGGWWRPRLSAKPRKATECDAMSSLYH